LLVATVKIVWQLPLAGKVAGLMGQLAVRTCQSPYPELFGTQILTVPVNITVKVATPSSLLTIV
jgi:hypothetical protein